MARHAIRPRGAAVLALSILLLGLARESLGENQYRDLRLPPNEIFEAVLGYAKEGNFDALGRSVKHFESLLVALKSWCGVDLHAELLDAILRRDQAGTHAALLRTLFADFTLNLFEGANASEPSVRRTRLEMAYVDLVFLAPDARNKDPELPRSIRDSLTRITRSEDPSEARAEAKRVTARLSASVPHCELRNEKP
jgi:hypothetical protein